MNTRKMLQWQCDQINNRLGLPKEAYTRTGDKLTANVGHIGLDHMQPGDAKYTWAIEQITSDGGGVTTLNTWQGRMTASECMAYLRGMHAALDLKESLR